MTLKALERKAKEAEEKARLIELGLYVEPPPDPPKRKRGRPKGAKRT